MCYAKKIIKCKNECRNRLEFGGTERKETSENRVAGRRGGSRGKNDGKMKNRRVSAASISLVQQQHSSSEYQTRQPVEVEGRSAHTAETAAAAAVQLSGQDRRLEEHKGYI